MATLYLGARTTSPTGTSLIVQREIDNQRSQGQPAHIAPSNGWISKVGIQIRKAGGDPKGYLVVRERLADGSPGAVLGRTDRFNVGNGWGTIEASIRWTGPGFGSPDTAVKLASGTAFLLEFGARSGASEVATLAGDTTHWIRSVASGYPTDPFLPDGSESAGVLAMWAVFEEDAPPSAPTALSPAAGAAVNASAPTFAGMFVDPDTASPTKDGLRSYRLEVRHPVSLAELWGGASATFAASATERSASRFERVYAGDALTGGQTVEWRAAVADDHLAWGPFSDWQSLTVNAAGQINDAAGTPASKVDTDPALIAWAGAVWSQVQGHAADRVQVRVLAESGGVVRLGATVVKAVANGAAFTVSAGEAGIGTLQPGAYRWQVTGRDASTGQWSPWSPGVAFSINAPPTVPAGLQPAADAASTSRPLAEWASVDPDADDAEGVDVDWEIEITRPDGSKVTRFATAYDAVRGIASYPFTATDLPAFGTYRWKVRGRDLSAGALGLSAWSAVASFAYVAGPTVTVTAPTAGQVVDTATPTTAWTVAGGTQVSYRVTLYPADRARASHASDRIVSAVSSYRYPAGWLSNGEWDETVEVWDTNGVKGTSLRRQFTVLFTPPEPLAAVEVSPDLSGLDVLVTWAPSAYPTNEVRGYRVYRREEGEAFADAALAVETPSALTDRWTDRHAPPGVPLVYAVTQLRDLGGGQVLESDPVEATVVLDLGGVYAVLTSVADPGLRFVVRSVQKGSDPSSSVAPIGETVTPWGSRGKPVPAGGPGTGLRSWSWSGVGLLDGPTLTDARSALAEVEALVGGGVLSVRETGRRGWGEMTGLTATQKGYGYLVDIEIEERAKPEGVA